MKEEYYRIKIDGEEFENLIKEYYKNNKFKLKIERTFFESIGIFKSDYLFYSIRCIYSKKKDDLIVSISYSSQMSGVLNYFNHIWLVLLLYIFIFDKAGPYTSIIGLFLLPLTLLLPAVDNFMENKIREAEGRRLLSFIKQSVAGTQLIDPEEYDALLKDRYCYEE